MRNNKSMRIRMHLSAVIALILLVTACASSDDESSDAPDESSLDASDAPSPDAPPPDTPSPDAASGSSGESSSMSTDDGLTDADIDADAADATDSVSIDNSDDADFSDGFDVRDTDPFNAGDPVPSLNSRNPANVTTVGFQVMESWPMQVIVTISGDLPTPCHEVWWEATVDGKTYDIQVWGVDPMDDTDCAPAFEPFTEHIPLGGGFINDDYMMIINGEEYPLNL